MVEKSLKTSDKKREYNKKWRMAHPTHQKKYRETHRSQCQAYRKKYYETHPSQEGSRRKKYRETHRSQCQAYQKKYYETHPSYRKKYYETHRSQEQLRSKKYRETHRKEQREHELKRNYGMVFGGYEHLLLKQKGQCAICGSLNPQTKHSLHFHVDHDHKSGVVRGLLCHFCNIGLGHFKDDIKLLTKAIRYLESWEETITKQEGTQIG